MTNQNELLWHQAIEDGNLDLAHELEVAANIAATVSAPVIEAATEPEA